MSYKTTDFRFFKNTPLIDFQNTIHFKSNASRDHFFMNENRFPIIQDTQQNFNFIRDKSTIDVSTPYEEFQGVNYLTFKSDFENVRYYAYVIEYEMIRPNLTRVYFLIDSIMTFTQGNVLNQLSNLRIQRQHLTPQSYEDRLWELKNNDDVIKTSTKRYIHENEKIFTDFLIIIQSSADLTKSFGDMDNPKINTSEGITFDRISSPLELYVVYREDFNDFMKALNPFPWIAQNIRSMVLVPVEFIGSNLYKAPTSSNFDFNELYRFADNQRTLGLSLNALEDLEYSMNELYALFGLDPQDDKHLLRNEYTTTEFYTFNGQQLLLDNGLLNPNFGIELLSEQVFGFKNELHIYPRGYNKDNFSYNREGTFLNNSISFNQFDDVPMLIDNYALSMANNANQRQLAESKTISNRIANVMNPNADLKDRFMDASSIISGFSPSNLFGKFTDEHEFYRNKQAQEKDLALATPTITNQSHGNSLQISNNFFGFFQKFSAPTKKEWDEIKKYYKLFGYEVNENSSKLENVESMSICNYVQFQGSWTIPNVDVALIEMMKAQFENGVRLWHNNGTSNPMAQDVLENKLVR